MFLTSKLITVARQEVPSSVYYIYPRSPKALSSPCVISTVSSTQLPKDAWERIPCRAGWNLLISGSETKREDQDFGRDNDRHSRNFQLVLQKVAEALTLFRLSSMETPLKYPTNTKIMDKTTTASHFMSFLNLFLMRPNQENREKLRLINNKTSTPSQRSEPVLFDFSPLRHS
jgi:hypothetical protein